MPVCLRPRRQRTAFVEYVIISVPENVDPRETENVIIEGKMREALDDMMTITNKKKDKDYQLTVMEAFPILRIQVPTDVNGALAHAQGETTRFPVGPQTEMLVCNRLEEL